MANSPMPLGSELVSIKFEGEDLRLLVKDLASANMHLTRNHFPIWAAQIYFGYVRQQFDTEGQGTWAQLSPMRIAQRGGSAHPILNAAGTGTRELSAASPASRRKNRQYAVKSKVRDRTKGTGDLRRVATSWMETSGDKVKMTRNASGSGVSWTLSGEKVMNQFGYTASWTSANGYQRTRTLPARPFWPDMNSDIADAMSRPASEFIDALANNTVATFAPTLKIGTAASDFWSFAPESVAGAGTGILGGVESALGSL